MKDLFGEMSYPDRPGYVRGSDTSQSAAESLSDETVANMRGKVLAFVKESMIGATCDEVEVALCMRHQTASARLRELVLDGKLQDTGERRLTRSCRPARVYTAERRK